MDPVADLQLLPLIAFRACRTPDGWRLQAPSGGLLAHLGVAPGDGDALAAAIHPDDAAHFRAPPADGDEVHVRLARPGDPWRWFSLRANTGADGYAGLLVEGDRQQALAASAQRYRDYAEISSDWYWEQDAELRFTYFSREFEQITGVPTASALGKTRWQGLGREQIGNVDWAAHRRETEAHRPFRNFEYASRRPDGRLVWFRVSGRPRFDADGRFLGYFGIASDITATKALEGELQQSQRQAALGQLAAGIAHEINNPLGFVRSNLGTLERYLATLLGIADHLAAPPAGDADAAWRARAAALLRAADLDFLRDDALLLLGECRDGLDRVRQIVGELREFAREGAADWCDDDLSRCLDSAAKLIAHRLPAGVELQRHYVALPPLRCRPQQLNQVFLALLSNALQAIGDGPGRITLSTGGDGCTLWAEVADDGCGIAAEHLPRLFEPFFTTRPVGSGRGMGLATCFGIVAEHGGRIDVDSAPGAGARFRVTLPRAAADGSG
ncbi:two-component system sensor histidine kinase NtrB [Azospira restricta]|uniref:histidine kinase n=1 Tax=Azospira restricta TaxID=404405 RepID=A0A974SR61_9RHOO|nr:ATP-binding protein [Azospira restricta]QRJ64947.1 PAS domain S-box protein [Azospira restricta]